MAEEKGPRPLVGGQDHYLGEPLHGTGDLIRVDSRLALTPRDRDDDDGVAPLRGEQQGGECRRLLDRRDPSHARGCHRSWRGRAGSCGFAVGGPRAGVVSRASRAARYLPMTTSAGHRSSKGARRPAGRRAGSASHRPPTRKLLPGCRRTLRRRRRPSASPRVAVGGTRRWGERRRDGVEDAREPADLPVA